MAWYVGHNNGLTAFSSKVEPTQKTHGQQFAAVVGPMSKRAAKWAEKYGYLNPHFRTTEDAERLSRTTAD